MNQNPNPSNLSNSQHPPSPLNPSNPLHPPNPRIISTAGLRFQETSRFILKIKQVLY